MAEDEDLSFVPEADTMCNICYAEFLDVEDLNMHIKQVHSSTIACKFCPTVFADLDTYALHIRDVHILILKCCSVCWKIFHNFSAFRRHEAKHSKSVPKDMYKCSQCSLVAAKVSVIENHEKKEHNNNFDGIYIDDVMSYLSAHLAMKATVFIQSLNVKKDYFCCACKKTWPDSVEYVDHLKKEKCTTLVCNGCNSVYPSKRSLLRHFRCHKECTGAVIETEKQCMHCDKYFLESTWDRHVKSCKPLKCRICGLKLDSIEEITKHQTASHPMAITMTSCCICSKEFVGSVSLQKHTDRVHSKELHLYKYQCVYCDELKVFKHPNKLFAHLFSKHSDVQPFSCQICNETFRVRKRFTLHIKLKHDSVGLVEFDENYHVRFTDKKSENPFQPKCLFADEVDKMRSQTGGYNTECDTDIDKTLSEAPTDAATDVPTDAEDQKKISKPPKMRFKEEKKINEVQGKLAHAANEKNAKEKSSLKAKVKRKFSKRLNSDIKVEKSEADNTENSDEEPLIKIKKKINKETGRRTYKKKKNAKQSFTCTVCDKYCYTYQNYNLHVATHYNNESKNCIKCSKSFMSTSKLEKHMQTAHSKSRLTEHLRNLLERKKRGITSDQTDVPQSVKFLQTFKKVESEPTEVTATIKRVAEKLSVQTFIENFTPEEKPKEVKNEPFEIETMVTIRSLDKPVIRPPSIKMTKFTPQPMPKSVKLAMPVKCKNVVTMDKPKITIKLIQTYQTNDISYENDYGEETYLENDGVYNNDYVEEENNADNKNEVPEVAQEVMLESQEPTYRPPNPVLTQQKIVLPKISNKVNPKDIKIAHLLPEAPFYKITHLKDILSQNEVKKEPDSPPMLTKELVLPSGRKLVNVNPLAHLIGDTPIEKLVGPPKSKYYKRKSGTYQSAVVKALLELESYKPPRKKVKVREDSTQMDKNDSSETVDNGNQNLDSGTKENQENMESILGT